MSNAVDTFLGVASCLRSPESFVRSAVSATPFPCAGATNTDSTACSKMKWQMMQQLFPGAEYGKYYYTANGKLHGTDNSIFSPVSCVHDTFHLSYDSVVIDTTGKCYNSFSWTSAPFEWGFKASGAHTSATEPTSILDVAPAKVTGNTICTTPSGSATESIQLFLPFTCAQPDTIIGVFTPGTSSSPWAEVRFSTTSANLYTDTGNITTTSPPYLIIGHLSTSKVFDASGLWLGGYAKISINSTTFIYSEFYTSFTGRLNSGSTIKVDINSYDPPSYTINVIHYTVHRDSLSPGIDPNTCRYRYQDTCLVSALKDTITIAGFLYSGLKTMSADSFRMIYNAAIAAGNYSIAEALLPLHPQYCELQNCFVDTFKDVVMAIPNWQVAQSLGMLTLDSLAAHDPLKTLMASSGLYPSPTDSLTHFAGTNKRLDMGILANAYCGCGDTMMRYSCLTGMFADEVAHCKLITDEVKDYYFRNLPNTYFALRQNIINKLFMRGGTSCAHCAGMRMNLDTATAVPPVPYSGDISQYSDSAFFVPGTGWAAGYAGMDTAALHDSIIAYNHYMDSVMSYRAIDTIMEHLTGCTRNITSYVAALRSQLTAMYTAGTVSKGNFSQAQIRAAITASGLWLNDLCNPYLVSAVNFGSSYKSLPHDCSPPEYYKSLDTFLNNALSTVIFTGTATGDSSRQFERRMARALGNNTSWHTSLSYDTTGFLGYLDVTPAAASSAGYKVRFYLYCPSYYGLFGLATNYRLTTACINNTDSLAPGPGLINRYAFTAKVLRDEGLSIWETHYIIGWIDTIQTMGATDNTLAQCIPCTQMKALYKKFSDSVSSAPYYIAGPGHPLYNTVLTNFMNSNLSVHYSADDYSSFMQSCALADSVQIPMYPLGYAIATFSTTANMNAFIAGLNAVNPAYRFDDCFRDSAGTMMRVVVNLSAVPPYQLWPYRSYMTSFAGYGAGAALNNRFQLVAPSAGFEAGFVYCDPSIAYSLADSNIFDTTFVKIQVLPTRWIYQGGRFVQKKCYNIVATAGTPPAVLSQCMYKLSVYFTTHFSAAGAVFVPCFQHGVNSDYYKPQKQSYLQYAYGYQSLPLVQVMDSLRATALTARIPSYGGYLAGYGAAGDDAGTFTNLYLSDSSMHNRYYDTLQRMINLASSSAGYGYIFYDAPVTTLLSGGCELKAYKDGDGSYWYRYFTTNDTMLNVYVSMPAYIPSTLRHLYHVVSVVPTPGDSLNRSFRLGLQKGGDTTVIYAVGRTDFVLSRAIALSRVMMGAYSDSATGADTFNNCERGNLLSAVSAGYLSYASYRDSVRQAVKGALTAYLAANTREQLVLSYLDHEHDVTLYAYDRAGNLTMTVPPTGCLGLPMSGPVLDSVDSARKNNTYCALPSYSKSNTYSFDSYDKVVLQRTIDGGKTRFMYDNAGRLIFSQNAKQAANGYYTYNIYDKQNRVVETGESQLGCAYFDAFGMAPVYIGTGSPTIMPGCYYSYSSSVATGGLGGSTLMMTISPDPNVVYNLNKVSYDSVVAYIRAHNRRDVVVTVYDTAASNLVATTGLDAQENLRKRVACVKYFEQLSTIDKGYRYYTYASHYSYDLEGNVKTLVQDFPDLSHINQQYKRVDYDYDVISEKVNMLSYNRGWPDQFYQRYSYDADNRITGVSTSSDGMLWSHDASYYYYPHGPLARVEQGDLRVQGIDYAYTIQGWLKGINWTI